MAYAAYKPGRAAGIWVVKAKQALPSPSPACLEDEAGRVHDGQVGSVCKLGAHHDGLQPG